MDRLIEALPLMIPIIALMIPVVKVFTNHQQKMAEIVNRSSLDEQQIATLRQEVTDLKSLLHQQTIRIDALASGGAPALASPPPAPVATQQLGVGDVV